jgi:predicted XRE-type DNA-binding protein
MTGSARREDVPVRWRYTSRAVYTVRIGDAVHAACVPEEVKIRHRYSATGCGVDREAVEGVLVPYGGEREIMMTPEDHSQGTENMLADLGFDDAEELSAKTILAVKLNDLVDKRGLSQIEAACLTDTKVSQIRRYKLQNILLERLRQALVSLDHVEIVVPPTPRAHQAGC